LKAVHKKRHVRVVLPRGRLQHNAKMRKRIAPKNSIANSMGRNKRCRDKIHIRLMRLDVAGISEPE